MFGERGYMTVLTRALARKRPQGLIEWCCSCCLPKATREDYDEIKVIHICPRTEENFEEDCSVDGEESVPVLKMQQVPTKESVHSDGRRVEPSVVKVDHVLAGEEGPCNKDILQDRKGDVQILRKHSSLDVEKPREDSAVEGMEIPVISTRHVHGDDNEGRIVGIWGMVSSGMLGRVALVRTVFAACVGC
jgi:hypothetical protein